MPQNLYCGTGTPMASPTRRVVAVPAPRMKDGSFQGTIFWPSGRMPPLPKTWRAASAEMDVSADKPGTTKRIARSDRGTPRRWRYPARCRKSPRRSPTRRRSRRSTGHKRPWSRPPDRGSSGRSSRTPGTSTALRCTSPNEATCDQSRHHPFPSTEHVSSADHPRTTIRPESQESGGIEWVWLSPVRL
jgi:hypothetical protein